MQVRFRLLRQDLTVDEELQLNLLFIKTSVRVRQLLQLLEGFSDKEDKRT